MNAFHWASLAPALPEIYLTAGICLLLLFDLFFAVGRPGRTATFTLVILLGGAAVTWFHGAAGTTTQLFDGMYIADNLATLLKLAAFLFMTIALFYSRNYLARKGIQKGEYYVLALTALLGILVLASANNLLSIYMGVELLSLSLYALVAFDRESGLAAEAAMKYFVLGAIASGTLLFGMSVLYGLSGTLDLTILSGALASHPGPGLILALSFVIVATAFKFGAVPFHMWVPDVYQGAPTSSALLVASVPKLASFALAFRLLAQGLALQGETWTQMLAILAVLSLVAGNLIAIAQTSLLRMLAYSAIANVGFILLGFVTGSPDGYQASLYFTVVYVFMVLAAFGVILAGSRDGFEADQIDHYKGLHARDPLLAIIMAVVMFSTAGIPPFVGFWAKLRIIEALVGGGHVWLALIAVVMSVIGAFYYLRVVWLMYFEAPGDLPSTRSANPMRLVLAINALVVFLLGVMPNGLLALCRQAL
jgi:NADH-quinone oxidoreductase subunit N